VLFVPSIMSSTLTDPSPPLAADGGSAAAAVEPLLLSPEQVRENLPAFMDTVTGHFKSQALYTIAKLKIADAIGSGCVSIDTITERIETKVRKEALYRCIRLLSTCGFFEEVAGDGFGGPVAMYRLTPMGALLQTRVAPEQKQLSVACIALHNMEPPMWKAWMSLPVYVAGHTDALPWDAANGMSIWDYYGTHEESSRPFNEFMSVISRQHNPVLLNIVPWKEFEGKRVVDVGGGFGTVACAIKEAFPGIDMYSLDLPDVVEQARQMGQAPPEDMVTLVGGNMFDAATYPEGASAMLLKHILHDWDDERSRATLMACHDALTPDGKVLVADAILPNPGEKSPAMATQFHFDVLMMLFSGKERTERQWKDLADSAGFKVESVFKECPIPNMMITTLVKK
jgi:SAM-dependent methyltransferase